MYIYIYIVYLYIPYIKWYMSIQVGYFRPKVYLQERLLHWFISLHLYNCYSPQIQVCEVPKQHYLLVSSAFPNFFAVNLPCLVEPAIRWVFWVWWPMVAPGLARSCTSGRPHIAHPGAAAFPNGAVRSERPAAESGAAESGLSDHWWHELPRFHGNSWEFV